MRNLFHIRRGMPMALILIGCMVVMGFSSDEWKLERNKNNIKVYVRNIEGSQLKEFRAVTTIKGTVPGLINLLKDYGSYHLWIENYKQAKELKRVNESESYFYLEIATPWPVNNRDIIVKFNIVKDPNSGSTYCHMKGIPDYIEKKSGVNRMPKFNGFWMLTPKEDGMVEVVCQVHAEPGGSVPDWLANSMMTDGPYTTMTRIEEWTNKPQYNTK